LPYPDLFDRSVRTLAATFARYGDLSYFSPVQRIGGYIEFTSRLKRRHLLDLIAYLKTCNFSTGELLDEEMPAKTTEEYLEQSLFHGRMHHEGVQKMKSDDPLRIADSCWVTGRSH
jgi:hypothetical protein